MVMLRSNDSCVEAFSPATQLRFLFSDVSFSARDICELHGYAPVPSIAMARILAGLALLAVDFAGLDDTISIHGEMRGPLGGFHAEMEGVGKLRGFLYNGSSGPREISGPDNSDTDLWGTDGTAIRFAKADSNGRIISQISTEIREPGAEALFLSFYGASIVGTLPVALSLAAGLDCQGRLAYARGLAMQPADESAKPHFEKRAKYFSSGSVRELLLTGTTSGIFRQYFGLEDLMTGPTRQLQFGCFCSEETARKSFESRTAADLQGMIKLHSDANMTCHMCGRSYTIPYERLVEFAENARRREESAR